MEARAYRKIVVSVADAVATVTLNEPERKNPLGVESANELLYALDDADADPAVRAIVLTGAGKAFSAGADLKQMAGGGGADAPEGDPLEPKGDYPDLLLRFGRLGKPIIARVPGPAMGGGLGLVVSCHFAVACESAVLGTPEIRRGLFPMMIMAVLRRVVPRRKLLEMMLLGEKLSAAQALELGLLTHVVPDDRLDAEVAGLAGKLAARSPTAMRMGLRAFDMQESMHLHEALPYLQEQLYELLGTDDAREGLTAFLEKRAPKWTGR